MSKWKSIFLDVNILFPDAIISSFRKNVTQARYIWQGLKKFRNSVIIRSCHSGRSHLHLYILHIRDLIDRREMIVVSIYIHGYWSSQLQKDLTASGALNIVLEMKISKSNTNTILKMKINGWGILLNFIW